MYNSEHQVHLGNDPRNRIILLEPRIYCKRVQVKQNKKNFVFKYDLGRKIEKFRV